MRKLLLLSAVFLFLTGCNQQGTDTPDAERVIRDTVAQQIFESLESPATGASERVQVLTTQHETPIKQSAGIQQLLKELKPAAQHFTINNSVSTEVKGKNGTLLRFAANSFCNAKGEPVSNPVEIELKECYRVSDLLAENINTTVLGDAFESKGAVYVTATGNGQALHLIEGRTIEVEFPFDVKQQGYCIYTARGEEWQPGEKSNTIRQQFVKPEFTAAGLSLKDYLLQTIQYPDYAKANELSAVVEATLQINENGRVAMVGTRSDYLVFREEVNTQLKNLPEWKPAMYGNKAVASVLKLRFDFNLRSKEQIQVTIDPNEITYLPAEKNADGTLAERHLASMESTGWFCVGTVAAHKPSVADVVVLSDANTDVRLIVKGTNCVLSATNFTGYSRTFQAGENAEVDVLAIKYENGKIFCSLQPIHLKKQNVIEPQWKVISRDELGRILERYPKVKV